MSAIACAICGAALAGWAAAAGIGAGAGPSDLADLLSAARPSPPLVRLFTPAIAPRGAYEVYVTDRRLDAIVKALRTPDPQGSRWSIAAEGPGDAFGAGGRYDPWKLARLFGAAPVRVSRGAVTKSGRLVASVTLLSPYPDPSLARVWPGTMIVVFRPDRWRSAP